MPNILIIDDNEEIQSVNEKYLTGHGLNATCVDTGIKALSLLKDIQYDCIVLDVLLPDLDGFALCKAARTITNTPIIFLSCLDESADKVKGLMAGGDDYLSKPYSLDELLARIHALMRRGERVEVNRGDIFIDREIRSLQVMGKNILLSEREFKLFLLFYENQTIVFSKEDIISKISFLKTESDVVKVLVSRLRRKLECIESIIGSIETVRGTGYRLTPPEND